MKLIYRNAILIIALLLCITSYKGYAKDPPLRNAYEIARSMYATKNFDTSQKGPVHEKLISALVWYTEADSFDNLEIMTRKHKLLNDYIIKTAGYFFRVDSLFYVAIPDVQRTLNELKIEGSSLISKLDTYKTKQKEVDAIIMNIRSYRMSLDTIRKIKNELVASAIQTRKEIDGLNSLFPGVDTINMAGLLTPLPTLIEARLAKAREDDSLIKDISSREEDCYLKQQGQQKLLEETKIARALIKQRAQNEILKNEYKSLRERYQNKTYTAQVLSDMYNPAVFKSNSLEFATAASGLDQQVHIQIAGQTSTPNFSMPSQSEMIDAVAIYLAKRVKQEAVLWFFDMIKKNSETDELINVCFPESMAMLRSGDMFEVPNFGTSWKYAMSKDFITLPENIFTSQWLENNVASEYHGTLNDLHFAITISRLLQQNYNYYEMIRYLYLNDDGMKNRSAAKHLITLLYSINQEMVNSENDSSSHLLSFEELNSMPSEAFILMIQLMDVKYGGVFSNIFGNISRLNEKDYRKRFIQYIGRIQLASQKIDQAKGQFKQMVKDNKESSNANYTYLSPWKFVGELLQVLQPDTSLLDASKHVDKMFAMSIHYLIRSQEIFENMEQRNYAGAVKMTINLVDSLTNMKSHYAATNTPVGRVYDLLISTYGPGKDVFDTTVTSFRIPKYWATQWKELYRIGNDAVAKIKSNEELYRFLTTNNKDAYDKRLLVTDDNGATIYATKDDPEILIGNKIVRPGLLTDKTMQKKELMALLVKTMVIDSLKWNTSLCQRSEKYINFYTNNNYARSRDLILRLAGFLNDIALSHNSKQLSEVVESYAMPSGSYKRKRNAWYSVDLNAFAGPYAGYEYPVNTNKPAGFVYGLSAPIGISYTKLLGRKVKARNINEGTFYKSSYRSLYRRSKSTFTIGLSIVDIGAVVSYRLTNTDSTLPQQFKWEQFISPGLHFSYGIPGTPLVWNFGAVYSPRIRKFADAANGDKQYNTFRIQTGLFFDLPLLNLWERRTIMRTKKYYRKDL